MTPGRELDALVAEKVMGCNLRRPFTGHGIDPDNEMTFKEYQLLRGQKEYSCECPGEPHMFWNDAGYSWLKEYSTDISAAFEVIAKVMPDYKSKISIETYDGKIWSIKPCGTSSNSLPHCICIAALKAIAPK